MKTIIFLCFLSAIMSSCNKTVSCTDPQIFIGFISIPGENRDTLILRKFEASGNFQTAIDTLALYEEINMNTRTLGGGDTVIIRINNSNSVIDYGFDWQLFNPATNTTYNISNIEKEDTELTCGSLNPDCYCQDKITNITVNNQAAELTQYITYELFLR